MERNDWDPSQKIGRPRQLYTGEYDREYVPLDKVTYVSTSAAPIWAAFLWQINCVSGVETLIIYCAVISDGRPDDANWLR